MENDDLTFTAGFQQIPRVTLQQQIVEQIEELIEAGKLKHGDRLPPERKLAEIFRVSRHSVREALRTLEEKGTLKSRPGSGTYVTPDDKSSVIAYVADAIGREKVKQKEVFEFRRLLEPQIAALAAKYAAAPDTEKLADLVKQQERCSSDLGRVKQIDQQFHLHLAKATGNRILMEIVGLLTKVIDKSRESFLMDEKRREKSVSGHAMIVEAVLNRDEILARQAMEAHIVEIEKIVTGSRTK